MVQKQIHKEEIDIKRNVIENILMKIKKFVKEYRSKVFVISIAALAVVVLIIGAAVFIDSKQQQSAAKFEVIMEKYNRYNEKKNPDDLAVIIKDLNEFVSSTSFGFSHKMGYYILGNIYFNEKKYRESAENLSKFVDKSSASILAGLALQKAAASSELAGDSARAAELYKKLENKYGDSAIADQVFFNLAVFYAKKGDSVNSRKYYNKVISNYPESSYSALSKKSLALMSAGK